MMLNNTIASTFACVNRLSTGFTLINVISEMKVATYLRDTLKIDRSLIYIDETAITG